MTQELWEALQAQAREICQLATERVAELKRESNESSGETSEHQAE